MTQIQKLVLFVLLVAASGTGCTRPAPKAEPVSRPFKTTTTDEFEPGRTTFDEVMQAIGSEPMKTDLYADSSTKAAWLYASGGVTSEGFLDLQVFVGRFDAEGKLMEVVFTYP